MPEILFVCGWLFTLVMVVDCYRRQRSSYWYWVLLVPGPLGGLAYLLYSKDATAARGSGLNVPRYQARSMPRNNLLDSLKQWKKTGTGGTVTPIESARKSRERGGRVNCSRCLRQVERLVPYEDGRVRHYACEMCVAEIELRRKPSISFPNREN